jgi:hypothetical protein
VGTEWKVLEMRKLCLGLLAVAAAFVAAPTLVTSAEAHQRGALCRYQQIDRDGDVRTLSRYCHHLPKQFQQRPRSGLTLYFDLSDGWYFAAHPRRIYRQEQVCLVTFFKRSQVEAGADKNVRRAVVLPRRVAERLDGPNDRNRIFDYGTNKQTRQTCQYLNGINNDWDDEDDGYGDGWYDNRFGGYDRY